MVNDEVELSLRGRGRAGRTARSPVAAQHAAHATVVPWAAYQALQENYEALVREVIAMKREGFIPDEPHGEPAKPVELPAVIEAAITGLGVDPATERQLRKTAWEFKRAGVADEEIAQRITEGEPVEL